MKNRNRAHFLKTTFFVSASLFLFLSGFEAKAQEENPILFDNADSKQAEKSEAVIVATVNIYDAKIVSQNGNEMKLSFDLSNREEIQPNVKYAVQLVEKESSGIVDEEVYEETVNLGQNETIHKEIAYTIPDYLNGNYQVWIISENDKGLSLGMNMAGEIHLTGNGEYVEIAPDACNFLVEGDGNKYPLGYAISVSQEEELSLECRIKNNFKNSISVVPYFETYLYSTFGKIIENEKQDAIILNPGENEKSFVIKNISIPQVYGIKLSFLDKSNSVRKVSNELSFQYITKGKSVTIKNLRVDKNYYQKGENAKVFLYWNSPPNSSFISRGESIRTGELFFSVSTKSSKGNSCSDDFSKELDLAKNIEDLTIPITSDCQNPHIFAQIKDSDGKVLDEVEFNFMGGGGPVADEKNSLNESSGKSATLLVFGLSALILIVVIVFIIKKKKNNRSSIAVLFVVSTVSFLLFFSEAKAETLYADNATYTVNLSSTNLSPGASLTVYGRIEQGSGYCNGYTHAGVLTDFPNYSNINTSRLGDCRPASVRPDCLKSNYGNNGAVACAKCVNGTCTIKNSQQACANVKSEFGSSTGNVSTTPGTYYVNFYGLGTQNLCPNTKFTYTPIKIPYTVTCTPYCPSNTCGGESDGCGGTCKENSSWSWSPPASDYLTCQQFSQTGNCRNEGKLTWGTKSPMNCNDSGSHCANSGVYKSDACVSCTGIKQSNWSPPLPSCSETGWMTQIDSNRCVVPNNRNVWVGQCPLNCSDSGKYCASGGVYKSNSVSSCTGTKQPNWYWGGLPTCTETGWASQVDLNSCELPRNVRVGQCPLDCSDSGNYCYNINGNGIYKSNSVSSCTGTKQPNWYWGGLPTCTETGWASLYDLNNCVPPHSTWVGQCPIDCQYTWSNWHTCTALCANQTGTQTRDITVSVYPQYGGVACPTSPQTQDCHGLQPSVDGQCGDATHKEWKTKPDSELCSSFGGSSNPQTSKLSWTWTCSGVCGGETARCYADRYRNMNWKEVAP